MHTTRVFEKPELQKWRRTVSRYSGNRPEVPTSQFKRPQWTEFLRFNAFWRPVIGCECAGVYTDLTASLTGGMWSHSFKRRYKSTRPRSVISRKAAIFTVTSVKPSSHRSVSVSANSPAIHRYKRKEQRIWNRENHAAGHECPSSVNTVSCQIQVSTMGWSLVQRRPTECARVSLRAIWCNNNPLH
jgi:hypothetical protein